MLTPAMILIAYKRAAEISARINEENLEKERHRQARGHAKAEWKRNRFAEDLAPKKRRCSRDTLGAALHRRG